MASTMFSGVSCLILPQVSLPLWPSITDEECMLYIVIYSWAIQTLVWSAPYTSYWDRHRNNFHYITFLTAVAYILFPIQKDRLGLSHQQLSLTGACFIIGNKSSEASNSFLQPCLLSNRCSQKHNLLSNNTS